MMQNFTSSYFLLDAYLQTGTLSYLYFVITLLLYFMIIIANTSVIVVICVNRSLHEPMYMFLCSLFVNELYGSTGLFPFLLIQILSDVHTVSAPLCFLQIFCLYSYGNVEFCNLAVMSYDRYLAICCPLRYRARMTWSTALVLVAATWLYSFIRCVITLCLNLDRTLCGSSIHSLYCQNFLVVKLMCSNTEFNNVYGVVGTTVSVLLPLSAILFSYAKILRVCFSASRPTRQKAVSTCTPHLASILNFSFGCFFEILQGRFDMSAVPLGLRLFLSLYFLILQPLLNPLMFGTQMSTLRSAWKDLLSRKFLR